MNAYPVFVHLNNLIRLKRTKFALLFLLWLLVSLACRSAASMDVLTAEPNSDAPLASIPVNQAGLTSVPAGGTAPPPQLTEKPLLETPEPTSTPQAVIPANTRSLPVVDPPGEVAGEPTQPAPPTEADLSAPVEAAPETDDLYHHLSIANLLERPYGGGEIQVHRVMGIENGFTRYLFSYPSDDLVIYGFANIPTAVGGPYPVVIALHGYVDPAVYHTLAYTTHYADTLARAGFIVLHPNLRNYPPSSSGENLFRVGMAIDVLNLIAIMEAQAGQPGLFENARSDATGLWGHSMGGGISLRVSVVNPSVRATVLYGAMSGDERQNFEAIYRWSDHQRGKEELAVPVEELDRIAPVYFLNKIKAAVSIHHGEADQMVPLQWSLDLCRNLIELGMEPECFTYPGQRHTFNQAGSQVFMEKVIDFFKRRLEP
jgi:uncharacterized protein